ncbi:MAG TPA: SLBB domain-containing protein [Gemmatimonadaceae bacterium]|nr:SLBB domain-containing protein [Gemmatimonadaceae bacterium]
MLFLKPRTLVALALFCVGGQGLLAQNPTARPTPEQARALLQARPELVQQLRQRLLNSGLTRDQIHARLRAEGYPEDLLDPYLSGMSGQVDAPSSELYNAVQELGIADSTDVAFLRALQADSLSPAMRDSLLRLRDTTGQSLDSLGVRAPRRTVVRADVADSLMRVDSGFNIFGLEMFRSSASRFEPSLMGPVDANYRLGPGDRLVLILTGDVEASYPLDVTREGFVVIPQVGQLYVANLTLGQLDELLYSRLGRVYSGVRRGPNATTRFSVSVSRLRTNQVWVLGEVERPGGYMVSSAGTAITALYAAGGPTANGSLRHVQIKRGNELISQLDLYDYLLRGDASRDSRLQTGDIVFVPPRSMRVRVIGEVIRPATYELKENETLADLIRAAGGFQANASRRRVQIERVLPPEQRAADGRDRVTIDVTASQTETSLANIPLEAGDVVRVFPIAERVRNTVVVQGNVWSPGALGIRPGMSVSDAIRAAGGPKPDVYLGQILVSRLRPDSSRVQMRAAFRDSTGAVLGDFALQEDDVIEVFSLTDFRPDRYVTIGGAVRDGGQFPYRQGMTMRDLILLAGGLEESAYLREAEIARLPDDRSGATTAVTIRVSLDSTYLFERRPGEPYLGAPGIPASAQGAPEVELRPYDNVLVLQQPSWELQRLVTIGGEVRFPGQYALKTRSERIADLIERAGGLTSEAYPEGTVFIRSKGDVGRVAIDVPQAMRRANAPDNLLLMDGDRITIPQRSNVVTVRGAVNAPNVVAYVAGKSISYYIDQAGGPARNADVKRAFITQPSGKRQTVSMYKPLPKPMPGSLVIIPEMDPSDRTNWIQVMAALAPVLVSLTTLILAL